LFATRAAAKFPNKVRPYESTTSTIAARVAGIAHRRVDGPEAVLQVQAAGVGHVAQRFEVAAVVARGAGGVQDQAQ
jgi:hypothetical protein